MGLSNSINSIKRNENCICLDVDDYMSDFIEISNRTKHTNYPIVSKKGKCYGMLRLIDINEYDKFREEIKNSFDIDSYLDVLQKQYDRYINK